MPNRLKKYDVFSSKDGIGKPRPYVVISRRANEVYAIPLTTTEDEHALIPCKSNHSDKQNFICKSIVMFREDCALEKYLGVFDDRIALNRAIRMIKKTILRL